MSDLKGNMDLYNTLGDFQRLSREIRDQIYGYFMPWRHFENDPLTQRRCEHVIGQPGERPGTNAIMRTSRIIYEETAAMLYDHWVLIFGSSSAIPYYGLDCFSFGPEVGVRVFHEGLGTCYLPTLISPRKSSLAQMYRRMPHARWKAVVVEITTLKEGKLGNLLKGWNNIKLIADILSRQRPKLVKIDPRGLWHKGGQISSSSSETAHNLTAADLHFLLAPLSRVADDNTCQPLVKLIARHDPLPTFLDHHGISRSTYEGFCNSLLSFILRERSISFQASGTRIPDGTPIERDRMDAWIDYRLDSMPGSLACRLREQRRSTWSNKYERRIIRGITRWPEDVQKFMFTALVQRWISRRSMNKDLCKEDSERFDRAFLLSDAVLDSNDEIASLRHQRYWNRNQLKFGELFDKPGIVVTSRGIDWDFGVMEPIPALKNETPDKVLFKHLPHDMAIPRKGRPQLLFWNVRQT